MSRDDIPPPEASAPEPDLQMCAHANLRRAMRVVSQHYDAALRPAGLRATQFTLLAVLAGKGPTPLTRLAELLVLDRTTLTRNLKPLTLRGLVQIGREEDERVRLVAITEPGRAVVEQALPHWREAQARVAGTLGQDRLAALFDDLSQLVETLRAD